MLFRSQPFLSFEQAVSAIPPLPSSERFQVLLMFKLFPPLYFPSLLEKVNILRSWFFPPHFIYSSVLSGLVSVWKFLPLCVFPLPAPHFEARIPDSIFKVQARSYLLDYPFLEKVASFFLRILVFRGFLLLISFSFLSPLSG